jgi:hypothetical protein
MKEIKVVIITAIGVTVVLAFKWLGQSSTAISAGIGALFKVLITSVVLAGVGGGAWYCWQRRSKAEGEPAPPPVHVESEQVPALPPQPIHMESEQVPMPQAVQAPAAQPAAIEPPREIRLHLNELTPGQLDQLAAILRHNTEGE